MIVEIKNKDKYGRYYLIVPDHAAGRRNRYTTYVIPESPSRVPTIIGRELTLSQSRRVVEHVEAERSQ